jgi:hypothetical protein
VEQTLRDTQRSHLLAWERGEYGVNDAIGLKQYSKTTTCALTKFVSRSPMRALRFPINTWASHVLRCAVNCTSACRAEYWYQFGARNTELLRCDTLPTHLSHAPPSPTNPVGFAPKTTRKAPVDCNRTTSAGFRGATP